MTLDHGNRTELQGPRCPNRCKPDPTPQSMSIASVRVHPGFKHLLDPGAQCELEHGHGANTAEHDVARRHRNGGLLWWDPPIILVGDQAA